MASLTSYFVKDNNNLIPPGKFLIRGKTYRFSVLSPRLIRIEYNKNGNFENRATSLVVNRVFPNFTYNAVADQLSVTITTEYFTLKYVKEQPISGNNIRITVNGTEKEWAPGQKDFRNCGSLAYSLDTGDKLKLGMGLYSLDGYAVIDDAKNLVIDNNVFVSREDTVDLYIFVYRSDFGLCLQDYFNLTGYPQMIPRYALGCWWFKNDQYNMYDIDNILKKFNDNNIPISVFLLGDKWHDDVEGYNYDKTLFDINSLRSYYQSKPQKFGLTMNPSIKIVPKDYQIYNEAVKYIKLDADNNLSLIPLNNNTVSVYLNLIVSRLMNSGINLFNIDYNNYNDKTGLFLLNHYHYVVANLKERGIILSRNSLICPHRYPIIFSGRTRVSWETLSFLATYNNSAANMGVSWHAHAIGGYYAGVEDAELYIRFIQFGVFNPIFILASDGGKYYKREPWKWNELIMGVIREYMQLRNKLVPYIYNESYTYHKYGVPLIQPLYYKYPKIYDEPNYVNQFFFGSRIMISPIVKRKNIEMDRVVQKIFIPNGIWYDFASGKKFAGNKYYTSFYKQENYPIFIKEGSIIPMSLDNDTMVPRNMEIQIFPAENGLYGSYELYEDDGISLDEKKNSFITKMNLDKYDNGYIFTLTPKSGQLSLQRRNYVLRFRNMKNPNNVFVKCGNIDVKNSFLVNKNDLIIRLQDVDIYNKIEVNIIGTSLEIEVENVINEEIESILYDMEINTLIKYKIDDIIFSDMEIKKKRIALRKLKKDGLEPKYINMFIGLLEFIETK